jgi:hypothetical protein
LICKVCAKEFTPTKKNQLYCDGICRRRIELKRKRHDMMLAYIRRAELAAKNPQNSAFGQEYWGNWSNEAKEKLKERP